MDAPEFQVRGREMLDYLSSYLDDIRSRHPLPAVAPGYLRELIPDHAPDRGDNWDNIMADVERVIMPGVTHWHSPQFHAYYPCGNSYPSILADMLSDGIGCMGFSWTSSPAATELEVSVMDWLAKMLQLPEKFLFSGGGKGGGVIQGSASEAVLMSLLSARRAATKKFKENNPDMTPGQMIDKLVAYTSEEAHCSVERAAQIGMVRMRLLPTDEKNALRGATLEAAIQEDRSNGLIPLFVCATVGTTSTCSFDNVSELGAVSRYDGLLQPTQVAESELRLYSHVVMSLKHAMACRMMTPLSTLCPHGERPRPDRRSIPPRPGNWQVSFGRRFRSLKLWFVLRSFGVSSLQAQIRKDVSLAKQFEDLVRSDSRFEVTAEVVLGAVCFRLKGANRITERLNQLISDSRLIFLTPSKVKGKFFIRFVVCAASTQEADVTFAWEVVRNMANKVHEENPNEIKMISSD